MQDNHNPTATQSPAAYFGPCDAGSLDPVGELRALQAALEAQVAAPGPVPGDLVADLLQRVIDGLDDPLTVIGRDHVVRFANSVAQGGQDPDALHERRCFRYLHGWERPCTAYGQPCPLEEMAAHPRPLRVLHEHITSDGSTRTVEVIASPFYGQDGAFEGIIERSRDITDRLRLDQEVERVHKLESLGVLAGGVAHDFNNLLTALQGTTELAWKSAIARGCPPDEKTLDTLRLAFARAAALTKQLLTFTRGGAPVARACSLQELVENAGNLAASGSSTRCTFSFPETLRPVLVDPGQFGQVIHNIVINAVQAMPDGGALDFSACEVTLAPGEDPSLAAGPYAKLTIRDDGPGMPPSLRHKVFEPYFTTKSTGSGLGLTVVYSIVARHGGTVRLHSGLGEGTTFEIYVPVARHGIEREKPSRPPSTLAARLLVMDDEPDVRDLVEQSLRGLGCEVDVASHGEQALALFEKASAQQRPYDAVILDLTVVDGMGGKETMRAIRARDPAVRGIVTSGYANDPVLAHPEAHGFDARLEKPYSQDVLGEVVAAVLAQRAQRLGRLPQGACLAPLPVPDVEPGALSP